MLDGYVEIDVFNNDIEAEIARGMLTENGIEALVAKDDCGGMMPNFQLTNGVRLYVLPKDTEKSKALLLALSEEDADTELMWHCSNCKTVLEPQFSACWKCGTERNT